MSSLRVSTSRSLTEFFANLTPETLSGFFNEKISLLLVLLPKYKKEIKPMGIRAATNGIIDSLVFVFLESVLATLLLTVVGASNKDRTNSSPFKL